MKSLLVKKMLILTLLISVTIPAFPGLAYNRFMSDLSAGDLFITTVELQKKAKVKKHQSARKAQKKQAAKDNKIQKNYEKYGVYERDNQRQAMEIQTPAVRERMKQNIRDANANYKAKKRSNAIRTKKGAKKYRR
jgi:hypothetical protein